MSRCLIDYPGYPANGKRGTIVKDTHRFDLGDGHFLDDAVIVRLDDPTLKDDFVLLSKWVRRLTIE